MKSTKQKKLEKKEKIKQIIKLLIFPLIIFIVAVVKVPYQVEMPGGIINLNDRVKIDGDEVDVKGSFNMAYVTVVQNNLSYVLAGLILPDWEVQKISDVVYENETVEDANNRDKIYLEESKNNAKVAAYEAAGIDYKLTNQSNYVAYISKDAKTTLKIGDIIKSVNGKNVKDVSEIKAALNELDYGTKLEFDVTRNGKNKKAKGTIINLNDEKFIGVSIITLYDIESEYDIEITSKAAESGPSGGMMMSLMIYNAITGQDLTNGKKIVGTGTISNDGKVGEIGGVKYKLMGAVKNEADVFLVPKGNYEEAVSVKTSKGYDIEIVCVETLQDAILYLENQ